MTQTVPSKFVVLAVGVAMCLGVLLGGYRERTHPTAKAAQLRGGSKLATADAENPLVWRETDGTQPPRGAWRPAESRPGECDVWLPSLSTDAAGEREGRWHPLANGATIEPGDVVKGVVLLERKVNCQAVAYVIVESENGTRRAISVARMIEPGP